MFSAILLKFEPVSVHLTSTENYWSNRSIFRMLIGISNSLSIMTIFIVSFFVSLTTASYTLSSSLSSSSLFPSCFQMICCNKAEEKTSVVVFCSIVDQVEIMFFQVIWER